MIVFQQIMLQELYIQMQKEVKFITYLALYKKLTWTE